MTTNGQASTNGVTNRPAAGEIANAPEQPTTSRGVKRAADDLNYTFTWEKFPEFRELRDVTLLVTKWSESLSLAEIVSGYTELKSEFERQARNVTLEELQTSIVKQRLWAAEQAKLLQEQITAAQERKLVSMEIISNSDVGDRPLPDYVLQAMVTLEECDSELEHARTLKGLMLDVMLQAVTIENPERIMSQEKRLEHLAGMGATEAKLRGMQDDRMALVRVYKFGLQGNGASEDPNGWKLALDKLLRRRKLAVENMEKELGKAQAGVEVVQRALLCLDADTDRRTPQRTNRSPAAAGNGNGEAAAGARVTRGTPPRQNAVPARAIKRERVAE